MEDIIIEGLQGIAILILILFRKVKYNPHPPGKADACIKHGTKLAVLETKVDAIQKTLNGKKD